MPEENAPDKLPFISSQILSVPLAELMGWPDNSRKHSDAQVIQLIDSIKRFGFTQPILIRGNTILAGHGRKMAALRLGMEFVPCIALDHLSETEARALVINDNKLALESTWDDEALKRELDKLTADGFDMTETGFSTRELDELFSDRKKTVDVTFQAGHGQGGAKMEYLEFSDKKVPINADEKAKLEALYSRYTEEFGTPYGFTGWLARHVQS